MSFAHLSQILHIKINQAFVRGDKDVNPTLLHHTLGSALHQEESFQPLKDPARCQEALHLPAWWRQCAVFFALLLSFAALLQTASIYTRDRSVDCQL